MDVSCCNAKKKILIMSEDRPLVPFELFYRVCELSHILLESLTVSDGFSLLTLSRLFGVSESQ